MCVSKTYDVIALGELLVDFAAGCKSGQGNDLFEACPGGAPCNVLAMLSRYGKKTSFLGKVGTDMFGFMLRDALKEAGIDTSHLYMDDEVNTTLAFVTKQENGDRAFSFYRNPGADMMLCAEEVDEEYLKEAEIFHFGTLSMTHEGVRKATKKALDIAKSNHLLISFDPNLRPLLWKSQDEAREQMKYGFNYCDVLKIADNEIQFFTGKEDYDEGVQILIDEYNIPLIFLTLGETGSRAYYKGRKITADGFRVNTIETTGAGDTFMGSVLAFILDHGIESLTDEELKEMLVKANAAAAIVTTRKGALKAMPEIEEVDALLYNAGNRSINQPERDL